MAFRTILIDFQALYIKSRYFPISVSLTKVNPEYLKAALFFFSKVNVFFCSGRNWVLAGTRTSILTDACYDKPSAKVFPDLNALPCIVIVCRTISSRK